MSVRSSNYSDPSAFQPMLMDPAAIAAASAELEPITGAADLGEGATGFQAIDRHKPLQRKVVVAIRASLAELTTNSGKAIWSPSPEQLQAIYQQKQFVDLGGEAAKQGNLKSVVLHSMEAKSIHSSFPIALGAKISGVEEKTFSSIGAPYSTIVMPNSKKEAAVKLQEDDVSVAYDFARRYPVRASNDSNSATHLMHTHTYLVRGVWCTCCSRGTRQKIWRAMAFTRSRSAASSSWRPPTRSSPVRGITPPCLCTRRTL